jgi:hypothetical protein
VPRRRIIAVAPINITAGPDLAERRFSMLLPKYAGKRGPTRLPAEVIERMTDEAMRWWGLHQLGGTSNLKFGHSFGAWWGKYHAAHPDYFAHPPEGERQRLPTRVKLCQGNPDFARQIVTEWKAAGMANAWNVCPNDGPGFCTCQRCRAMDGPETAEATPEQIWSGNADLSRRHLTFCNRLLAAMKPLNPQVSLCTYAYSAYREPPKDFRIEPGLAIEFVGSYTQRDVWQRWADAGVKLGLRPNWLHSGAIAPNLPLRPMAAFCRYAREHGMLQYNFDSLHGYWGTMGPNGLVD